MEVLFFAILVDLIIGDPRKLPHLVKGTAILAHYFETYFSQKLSRTVSSGILFYVAINASILLLVILIRYILYSISTTLGFVFEVIVIFQCIAAHDLYVHVKNILIPLRSGNLREARSKLSRIVGRDTRKLNESEISRAAIESLAESASDGVIAPIFWTILLGMPGALIYRVTNTLDSMVGHRDEKYESFGKCSARMDDVLNFIPARLTAFLMGGLIFIRNYVKIAKDARKHNSPNAGWPEATMAYRLDIQLGGDNVYEGEKIPGAILNPKAKKPDEVDLENALKTSILAYFWVLLFVSVYGFSLMVQ